MARDERMKGIQDDLESTARDLELISQGLAGHARFLSRTVHAKDAVAVEARIDGLKSSIDDLRTVADSIEP